MDIYVTINPNTITNKMFLAHLSSDCSSFNFVLQNLISDHHKKPPKSVSKIYRIH